MSERKVLLKYFPKNFDPKLLVKRGRGKDKLMNVRNMLPMSLRCNVCQNYLYIGTKFNMRMEISNEEAYLGIKVFRFYLKCTYCYNDIAFKTDPKHHDYVVEEGGTRNYEPIKDAEHAQKLLNKMKKQEKQGNSMKFLETKTYDSKREMELMEALDDIKNLNKRHALIDPEDLLNNIILEEEENQKFTQEQQEEIERRFSEVRKKKIKQLQKLGVRNEQIEERQQKQEQDIVKEENVDFAMEEKEKNWSRMLAIQKGGLLKTPTQSKQESQDTKKSTKSKVPKFKIIKKNQNDIKEKQEKKLKRIQDKERSEEEC